MSSFGWHGLLASRVSDHWLQATSATHRALGFSVAVAVGVDALDVGRYGDRGDDFEDLDRGFAIAVDRAEAAVERTGGLAAVPSEDGVADAETQVPLRLDAAEDVVGDQDRAERGVLGDDGLDDLLRHRAEVHAREAVLDHVVRLLEGEEDLAAVEVAIAVALQDVHVRGTHVEQVTRPDHEALEDQKLAGVLGH